LNPVGRRTSDDLPWRTFVYLYELGGEGDAKWDGRSLEEKTMDPASIDYPEINYPRPHTAMLVLVAFSDRNYIMVFKVDI